jgi:CHAT domain-containing protein/tetratricopeptide (TPR) repeat protein
MHERQWLKKSFQRLFGTSSQLPREQQGKEQEVTLPTLSDADIEFLFRELLEGVYQQRGLNWALRYLQRIENRINHQQWLEWLGRFAKKMLSTRSQHFELAARMVHLGELGIGEIGDVAGSIGIQLLGMAQEEGNRRGLEKVEVQETPELDKLMSLLQSEGGFDPLFELSEVSYKPTIIGEPIHQSDAIDEAEVWLNQGFEQWNNGDLEAAIISWDKATEIRPDYHEAWYNRGLVLVNLGQYEEAIASYDKALELKPDDGESWLMQGSVLSYLGQFAEAIASFDRVIELESGDYDAWHNRGDALDNLGRHEEAMASYDKALEIKPNNGDSWYSRGIVLLDLGRHEEAIASLNKALEFKPDFPEAWTKCGVILNILNFYEESLICFDRALDIESNFSTPWGERGIALSNLGRYEEAIASYDKAIEIKPDFYEAWQGRGIAVANLGRDEEAIASFDKVIEFKPDEHQAWVKRGIAAGKSASCNYLLASLSLTARQNPTLNQRGYEGELASYEEGLKYCQQDTHPEGWGWLHREIGNAHYLRGRRDSHPPIYWHKAVTSYNLALKIFTESDLPELELLVLQDLISVQLDLGQTETAEELQQLGMNLLQRLLEEANRHDENKKQLSLKFAGFQQLAVDLAVQFWEFVQAIEFAEQGKNDCLNSLLDGWSDEISSPSYPEIEQLLNPTTAIIYWHISPYALHTFILKHEASEPMILGESRFVGEIGLLSQAQRLRDFETWMKDWEEQSANYRSSKGKRGEDKRTWRDNLPKLLRQLGDILDINALVYSINSQSPSSPIKNQKSKIKNLILIPHRDLHRFPLHALFPAEFTITYLPSAQIGITLQREATPTRLYNSSSPHLLTINPNATDYPSLEFAHFEFQAMCRIFPKHTPIRSEKATESNIVSNLIQGYSIFHFTGQRTYDFHNPALSYLALAGDEKLTLADIRNLDLTNYQLVTLTACETPIKGDRIVTTEYAGFVSAFMECGVPHIISTLWNVESSASASVMVQFYELLQQGKPAVVALNQATQWLRNITNAELAEWYAAQIAKLPTDEVIIRRLLSRRLNHIDSTTEFNNQPYSHPYFWAGFTITGLVISH